MANSKISALTSATTPLAGTEVLPIVQSSATVKVATNDLTVRNIRANATTGILQITGPLTGPATILNETTNESITIIESLSCVKHNLECNIYTDSQLCINCATGKWGRKANLDLWKEYDKVSKNKKISFTWVKGHSGDKYNEIVDKLAYTEAKNLKELKELKE